jgi:protein involved in polysaccharide export with SLBB domain
MTVRDLLLAAQGLAVGADPTGVELVREHDPLVRSDTLATLRTVPLGTPRSGGRASPLESPLWIPSSSEFVLQPGDEVIVRRAPGYEPPRRVIVAGEVLSPGPYPLPTRTTRLLDVVRAAGGPTGEADVTGLRVVRGGLPVGTNYAAAARDPRGRYNLVLEAGDSVVFPTRDNTVQVVGAVAFQSRVLYRAGRSVGDYVAEAGGYTPAADRKRVSVTYPNGERTTLRRSGHRRSPEVSPGSIITVPVKVESANKTDWGEVATRAASILGSLVTLLVVIDRIRN